MKKKIIFAVMLASLLTACSNNNSESKTKDKVSSEAEVSAGSSEKIVQDTKEIPVKDSSSAELTEELITEMNEAAEEEEGILISSEDIQLADTDGMGTNYTFQYDGETYNAIYTPDNWKIIDSYKITCEADMIIICTALASIHPVRGSDGESLREPWDMAYEWVQHNIAYNILPDGDKWKDNAKDVDINPADQNKSLYEMYKNKTGGNLM